MQIGDGGRHAAAERSLHCGLRGGVGLLVIERDAENLVAVLVGRSDVRPAAFNGGRGSATARAGAVGDGSGSGGVALADALADVGVGQLSHADSSSSASGLT